MIEYTTVKLAAEKHAAQIAEMSRDHIEHGLGWGWTRQRVLGSIRDTESNVGVIVKSEVVHAFGIMRYGERHAHLELLAVRPESRRKGLGRSVVLWLEEVARVAGAERTLVECRRSNDAARHLYLELGYHEIVIERGMYRMSEDGIHLEKWLRPGAVDENGA